MDSGGAGSFFILNVYRTDGPFRIVSYILFVCDTSTVYVVVHTWRTTLARMSSNVDRMASTWTSCFSSCVQLATK